MIVEKKMKRTSFGTINFYVKTDKGYCYLKNPCVGTKRISKREYEEVKSTR